MCQDQNTEDDILKMIEVLVKNGADINRPVEYGNIALSYLVINGNVKAVDYILNNGADYTIWIETLLRRALLPSDQTDERSVHKIFQSKNVVPMIEVLLKHKVPLHVDALLEDLKQDTKYADIHAQLEDLANRVQKEKAKKSPAVLSSIGLQRPKNIQKLDPQVLAQFEGKKPPRKN